MLRLPTDAALKMLEHAAEQQQAEEEAAAPAGDAPATAGHHDALLAALLAEVQGLRQQVRALASGQHSMQWRHGLQS
jgi:predicted secreted protein